MWPFQIVDTETGNEVGCGEEGEVWVRGPQIMKGYHNNPSATQHTVDAHGWLHTGVTCLRDKISLCVSVILLIHLLF